MIHIRPLNPGHTFGHRDTLIGRFADSEWQDLIELVRRYGFEPPNNENYLPSRYDEPIEIDAETSQGLLEAMSAVFNDDAIPPGVPSAAGRLGVRQLIECAQLGAEQGGIEIRRSREEVFSETQLPVMAFSEIRARLKGLEVLVLCRS